jgi:exoribonuclease II
MKKETDYTFVTIDNDTDSLFNDAVVIDVDQDGDLLAAVTIDDDSYTDSTDFITLSDDTIMLSDSDMTDIISTDMDENDISVLL